jgi:hypothetical protein
VAAHKVARSRFPGSHVADTLSGNVKINLVTPARKQTAHRQSNYRVPLGANVARPWTSVQLELVIEHCETSLE